MGLGLELGLGLGFGPDDSREAAHLGVVGAGLHLDHDHPCLGVDPVAALQVVYHVLVRVRVRVRARVRVRVRVRVRARARARARS